MIYEMGNASARPIIAFAKIPIDLSLIDLSILDILIRRLFLPHPRFILRQRRACGETRHHN